MDNADYGQESHSQQIRNTVIYQYSEGSFGEDTVENVAKEKKKNHRRSVGISTSKPVIFEPDVTKTPEYYQNVCHEVLEFKGTLTQVWKFYYMLGFI